MSSARRDDRELAAQERRGVYHARVRGGLVAIGLFAGCYDPSFPVGAPCATGNACPGTLMCVADKCVVPGSVDAGGVDSGVVDAAGCVQDPSAQDDEDGDQLDDACDPCPLRADNPSLDSDANGIANGCDFGEPGPHDRIWLFQSFADPPSWANWPAAGDHDHLRVTAQAVTDLVLQLSSEGRVFNNFRVKISINVENVLVGVNDTAAIGLRIVDRAGMALKCSIYQYLGHHRFALEDDLDDDTRTDFPWMPRTEYTLALELHDHTYTCTLGTGDPANEQVLETRVLGSEVVPTTGAAVSVNAFAVTATLDWVYVIGP